MTSQTAIESADGAVDRPLRRVALGARGPLGQPVKGWTWAAYAAAAAVALVLPYVVTNPYYLGVVNFMLIFSISSMGLNLILGYTGLLSMGQAAFYGIGAYTTAILMGRHGVAFVPALLASAVVTLVVALLLGIPTRKVRGDYFSLLTIALGEIFRLVVTGWIDLTGGAMGIVGVPIPSILGWKIMTERDYYYVGLALLAFTFGTMAILVRSKPGRALIAIREDELAAQAMGIDSSLYMIIAFAIGSLYAGMAGSLLAVYQTTVTPSNFRLEDSTLMVVMVIVGGMGRLWTPIVGVLVMTVATEVFRPLAEERMLIIGAMMIVVLLFRPQGMFGTSAFKD